MPNHPESIQRLALWLKENDPHGAIMPCISKGKSPAYPHTQEGIMKAKNERKKYATYDEWTAETYMDKAASKDGSYGILVNDVMVVDFDNQKAYDDFIKQFPDAHQPDTPCAATKKGRHLYFKRPDGVFNKDAICPKTDIKTVYGNGTRALVCVYPSENKQWEVAPWDGVLREPPTKMIEWLQEHAGNKSKNYMQTLISTQKTEIKNRAELEPFIKVIDGIDPKRAEEYGQWIHGVWGIMSIPTISDEEKLTLCRRFSNRSPKGEYQDNEDFYRRSLHGNHAITFNTLWWWLKQDNPTLYDELRANDIGFLIDTTAGNDGNHFSVARVIYELLKDKYAFTTNGKQGLYFTFENHRWSHTSVFWPAMCFEISCGAVRQVMKRSMYWSEQASRNPDDRERYLEKADKLAKICVKMGTSTYKDGLVKELKSFFYKSPESFLHKLNSKTNLIGFKNGVYDLESMTFRDGLPEDLITFTTGYDYSEKEDVAAQTEVKEFVKSIMPSEAMEKYIWEITAYSWDGNKKYQNNNLHFYTGLGANGKGVLKALDMGSKGDYAVETNAAIFSHVRKDSSAATSELMRLKGKRTVWASEPPPNVKLNVASLKEWTGRDAISGRQLYGDTEEFIPQFSIGILMNIIPELTDVDGGIVRRVRIVPFPHVFKEKPIPGTNQKQMIVGLDEKFKNEDRYKLAYFQIAMKEYKRVVRDGMGSPNEVMEKTKEYLEECDKVHTFIESCIVITNDKKDMIPSSQMFNMFKASDGYGKEPVAWFNQQMLRHGLRPEKKTTRGEFCMSMVYFGVKRKDEEVADSDEEN
jgi:P4 family phage/plasmid primase-like protien